MTQPYRGEMFLGSFSDPLDTASVYLQFREGDTPLPYVPGTACWFSGTVVDFEFVPDGRCWPAEEAVPGAGLIAWTAPSGATHGRVYARVSCDDWAAE
jgi:hypothetical protein